MQLNQARDKLCRDASNLHLKVPIYTFAVHPAPRLFPDHVNKPFHNLTLSDIDGAHPKLRQPFRQPRGTDPLDPAYVVPAYDEPEPEVPRFSKDALDVSDVAGAKPRKKVVRRVRPADASDGCGLPGFWIWGLASNLGLSFTQPGLYAFGPQTD